MHQLSKLGHESLTEIPAESPGLKLPAMSQLMRQGRQIAAAMVGEKHPVPQCHCSVSAEPQHHPSEQSRRPGRFASIESNSVTIEECGETSQVGTFSSGKAIGRHVRLSPQEFPDWSQRFDVITEDLEGGDERHGDKRARHPPDPPPEHQSHEDGDGIQGQPASQNQW
jgi:hypothetical protein